MRLVRKGNSRGLSEIVGTLMLVLIVVGAAVAFSAFVASYQKQVQAEQAVAHQRALENLKLLSIDPTTFPLQPTNVSGLTYVIASLDVESTVLTGMSVNGIPVKFYNVTAIYPANGTVTPFQVGPGFNLEIAPEQQVFVQLDLNASHVGFSMYAPSFVLHTTDVVKVNLYTAMTNDFLQIFSPPTAVAFLSSIQSFTGTGYVTEVVLDGSQSLQPGNGSIVSWEWSVTDTNTSVVTSYEGEKAVPVLTGAPGNVYAATLTVTNSAGLVAVATTPTFT